VRSEIGQGPLPLHEDAGGFALGRPLGKALAAGQEIPLLRACVPATDLRRAPGFRLASVAQPYARKTTRLHELLRLVGFVLGGEGGARPLCRLGMSASSSTLLRYVRDSPSVLHPPPNAVGIDNWAFRSGHRYGTIVVDLEKHEVIDLLEDREAGLRCSPG
jgi:hypothetical protein